MAERLTRDAMLMHHAKVASLRGTCSRLKVGAVFARDGRIVTTGYNGAPKGIEHCDHACNCKVVKRGGILTHKAECRSMSPCPTAQHAERNGIDFAARHGLSLIDTELFVTHAPCLQCAGSLLNVGVRRVSFLTEYRLTTGIELLARAGVEVLHMPAPVDMVELW